MSPRVVSLRTGQTPSQAQKRSGKDGKCTRNCPVERKRVPQKVNCSSGFEGGATRGTRSREYEGGKGFCQNGKTPGAVGRLPLCRIPFCYISLRRPPNTFRPHVAPPKHP